MLKNCVLLLVLSSFIFACKKQKSHDAFSFEKGNFITYLENKKDSSVFYRVDNLQIEAYRNKVDTFDIKWKKQI